MEVNRVIFPLPVSSELYQQCDDVLKEIGLGLQWLITFSIQTLSPYVDDVAAQDQLHYALIERTSKLSVDKTPAQPPLKLSMYTSTVEAALSEIRHATLPYVYQLLQTASAGNYVIQVENPVYHGAAAVSVELSYEHVDELPPTDADDHPDGFNALLGPGDIKLAEILTAQ